MTVMRSSWVTGTVLSLHEWTPRLFSLRIQAELMPFKAGQFVRLQLPVTVNSEIQLIAKSYSLVNAPDEPDVEVFFNTVPNGRLSNALAALNVGDSVDVSQPANGFFTLDEVPNARHLWMVATGTGLGPYLSMLKTPAIWQRFERIALVHGVPLGAELAYQDWIQAWQVQYPQQFQFVSCVTREANPAGLNERVTTALASGALEKAVGLNITPRDAHVMLCGNHQMLNDMKALLEKRDLQRHLRHKAGHITTEQYF